MKFLLVIFTHFVNFHISFTFIFSILLDVPDIVCQDYAVPHMQDLIPTQKSNSLYSGAGSILGGVVSSGLGSNSLNGSNSNYSTTLTSNRNTLNNMFHMKIPPPPPPPSLSAANIAMGMGMGTGHGHGPASLSSSHYAGLQQPQTSPGRQQQQAFSSAAAATSDTLAASEKYYAAMAICKANMSATLGTPNNAAPAAALLEHQMNGATTAGKIMQQHQLQHQLMQQQQQQQATPATGTLPNGKSGFLVGNFQNALTLPTNKTQNFDKSPTGSGRSTSGVVVGGFANGPSIASHTGGAGSSLGVTLTKPQHYNVNELSDFMDTTASVSANTAASGADTDVESVNCQLQEFPRHSLVIVEKLGCGVFGEYHLCETRVLR